MEAPLLEVKTSPFAYTVEKLEELIEFRSQERLIAFEGIDGLVRGLLTDPVNGIKTADKPDALAERKQFFGENVLPPVKRKTLFELMWLALQDQMLVGPFSSVAVL